MEHGTAILTVAAQLGVFLVFVAIRDRFYCVAEFVLVCAGVLAIAAATVFEEFGYPSKIVEMGGWMAFLIGLLVQFAMPKGKA